MTLNAEKRKEKVRKNCKNFGKQENQKTGKIMQIRTKATGERKEEDEKKKKNRKKIKRALKRFQRSKKENSEYRETYVSERKEYKKLVTRKKTKFDRARIARSS